MEGVPFVKAFGNPLIPHLRPGLPTRLLRQNAVAAPRCTSLYTSGVPHHLWNGDVEWGVAATSFFLASGAHLGSREVKVYVLEMLMITGFARMR